MLPPKLTQVQSLSNFRLQLKFANGEQRELDMTPYLEFGIFSRLRDPVAFAQAQISFDTIEWPCGVDLDPAFVYQKSRLVKNTPNPTVHGTAFGSP